MAGTMKAMVLPQPAAIDASPLVLSEVAIPEPADDEVLVQVSACGICRTDLHVVEGELPPKLPKVVPGHQIVGRVVRGGSSAGKFRWARGWVFRGCLVLGAGVR